MRKKLLSACLGNFFEHYDTALFGFLSPFLAPLIFPKEDPITALILTYAMIPLGMLARPVGAIFFGSIGDRYGRERALFLTLGGMGVVSGCIALSPTYTEVGLLAPLIFCLGRILHYFFASGETMGGAIYLLENTPDEHHDVASGFYSATTIGGILLASIGVSLLSWRMLYLLGSLTALFGCFLRKTESKIAPKPQSSLWLYRREILLLAIGAGFSYANYSLALILMNGFIPLVTNLTQGEMATLNTKLLAIDFCALPLFGWLSYKIGRERMMLGASLSIVLFGIPLITLLEGASLTGVIAIRLILIVSGVAFFAPFHAFAQNLVPKAHRYGVISFAYAIGAQTLGGLTAPLSLFAFQKTGLISSIAWYWWSLSVLSTFALLRFNPRKEPISP